MSKNIIVATLGLGQGGSNLALQIAAEFGSKNIGIVNLSSQDLGTITGVDQENLVNLSGVDSSGAGKDRLVGKGYFAQNMDKIAELAAKIGKGADYLFVCYSLAGGTGSGLGPTVTGYLNSEEIRKKIGNAITIIGLPILPDSSEGSIAMTNACEALEEIHKLSLKQFASFAIVDNSFSKAARIGDKYAEVNSRVAADLKRYLTIFGNSRDGCLDAKDRARGLGIPGLHSFVSVDANGFPHGPFKIPEGSRVKLALCELPEGKSELFSSILTSLGVAKDDQIIGFADAGNIPGIVHLAGYNTATKIAEEMRAALALIKNKAIRQEAEDLSGKGFNDLASEKAFLKDQYGKKTTSAQDILDILG